MTPFEQKKWDACMVKTTTLDGKSARIGGWSDDVGYVVKNHFIGGGPGTVGHIELSWETIFDVVENKDGKFSSKGEN